MRGHPGYGGRWDVACFDPVSDAFAALTAFLSTDAAAGVAGAGLADAAVDTGLGAATTAAFAGGPLAESAFGLTAADLGTDAAIAGTAGAGLGAVAPSLADATTAAFAGGPLSTDAFGLTASDLGGGIATGAGAGSGALTATAPVADAPLTEASFGLTPADVGVTGDVAAPGVATTAPGITATSPTLSANASALGGVSPTAPGPGAAAFAPPSSVAPGSVDLTSLGGPGVGTPLSSTDAGTLGAFQANVPTGATSLGADTADVGAVTPEVGAEDPSLVLDPTTGGAPPAPPGMGGAVDPSGDTIGIPNQIGPGTTYDPVTGAPSAGQATSNFFHPLTSGLNTLGNAINSPTGRVFSTGISLAGLGRSLLTPSSIPGEDVLQSLASQLGSTGTSLVNKNAPQAEAVAGQAQSQAATLENYLTTGTLPTPVQSALNQATQSAVTNRKAYYASKGEPPNSTAEQQDIASIEQNAIIQGGTLAAQLYSQGVGLDQLASSIYTSLVGAGTSAAGAGVGAQESVVGTNTALNTGVNTAIANLATALGGGSHAIVNGTTFVAQAA